MSSNTGHIETFYQERAESHTLPDGRMIRFGGVLHFTSFKDEMIETINTRCLPTIQIGRYSGCGDISIFLSLAVSLAILFLDFPIIHTPKSSSKLLINFFSRTEMPEIVYCQICTLPPEYW
jgi:hypothetical protein